jgi:uncharacterized hydrophobic protein (TIGR00271 family)
MAVTDTQDDLPYSGPPTAAHLPIVDRSWWYRRVEPAERRRIMNELAITKVDYWAWRFTIMLTFSVVVAVMGLSADSAAVVIGAMLLAPLMQPVLATAACLSMSLFGRALWALIRVLTATAWCIMIAYVLSRLIPDGPLPGEVEARTRPDIRDLVVALAAGAAGAYATVRRDASSALPGVAVAVALVPPLATVGITLEAAEPELAVGAALLYGTNLAAIIFAGVMVFIATGFVPARRLANTALQLIVAGVITLALVVVVAVPLFGRSAAAVEAAQHQVAARSIVDAWLNGLDLSPEVNVADDRVLVRLRGFDQPPDDASLIEALQAELGEVTVLVEWVRTERATTTLPAVLTDEEALELQLRPLVQQWLVEHGADSDYELEDLMVEEGVVRIDVAGTGLAPSFDGLKLLIDGAVGVDLAVRINWTERQQITPGSSTTTTPIQRVEEDMFDIARDWADEFGVELEWLVFDGERVEVVVSGPQEPLIYGLIVDLEAVGESPVTVEVYYTPRLLVTTTLPIIDVFGGFVADITPEGAETPTTTTTTTTG